MTLPRFTLRLACLAFAIGTAACGGGSPATPVAMATPTPPPATQAPAPVTTDAALFRLVTQGEPFTGYALFPNADEFATGRLNGSEAHNPLVRVSVNPRAMSGLSGGRLAAGATFPDGSVVFKELRSNASTPAGAYAVMYKDGTNPLAGNGWLWAEFNANGSTLYSISNRGAACTGCHQRERGPQNDSVRTFERQR
jgi:hypothetical protein